MAKLNWKPKGKGAIIFRVWRQPSCAQSKLENKSIKWIDSKNQVENSTNSPFQTSLELLQWFAESRKHLGKNKVHVVYHLFYALFKTNKHNEKVEWQCTDREC